MRTLDDVDRAAIQLWRDGRVRVTYRSHTDLDEMIVTARVHGKHGVYETTIDPTGTHCTCSHGLHRGSAARCSHVRALVIACEYTEGGTS